MKQPMLSAKIPSDTQEELEGWLAKLTYPMIGSPKVDGIRVICHPVRGAVTRTLNSVPNETIREFLSKPEFAGFDGEVTWGWPHQQGLEDIFKRSHSMVMTGGQHPDTMFTFAVFDDFTNPLQPYKERIAKLNERVEELDAEHIHLHEHCMIPDANTVLRYETDCLDRGYEGIMLRSFSGEYKFNRSTFKQQGLLKLKRREEAEGVITGFEPLYTNNNVPTVDARGYTRRSSHQGNLTERDTLGALVIKCQDFSEPFSLGTGFSADDRDKLWAQRNELLGRCVTFVFQRTGTHDKPRFPTFKSFREGY